MITHKSFWQQHRVLLILAVVVAIIVLLIASQFEQKNVKKYQSPSQQAQQNQYLALSRFLKPHGINVDNQERKTINLQELPSTQDILMLTQGGELQSLEDQDRLLSWINQGGRLILTADARSAVPFTSENEDNEDSTEDEPGSDSKKSSLLPRIGLVTSSLKYPDDFTQQNANQSKDQTNTGYNFNIQLPSGERVNWHHADYDLPMVGIHDDNSTNIVYSIEMPKPAISAIPETAFLAVQLRYGKGQILLLNSDTWLTNNALKEADNAHIALQMLNSLKLKDESTSLLIFSANPYRDTPNLIVWLWQRAHFSLLAGGLCLLLGLWRYRWISGPKLMPRLDARRDLLEHLHATGWFIYGADKGVRWIEHLKVQFHESLPKPKNLNEFIEQSRHFQSRVKARFNRFSRHHQSIVTHETTEAKEKT